MKFTIIQDTREQFPWKFDFFEHCKGIKVEKLNTGDYSIVGLEDIVTIERKRTTGEIAMNIGSDSKRFKEELVRMSSFKYKYIICEFTLDRLLEFPVGSTIPQSRWSLLKMRGKYMAKCLLSYKELYGIEVIFCDDNNDANRKAAEILKDVYSKEMV